jgi:hypothetical protein
MAQEARETRSFGPSSTRRRRLAKRMREQSRTRASPLDRVVSGLSRTRALKSRIIRAPTLDKEDISVTDQSNPHDQHDSELQLLLTIGIQGFRELVAWVAEGATPEDRHARGSQVREVIDAVVKNTDSAKINQALLDEAERLSKETPR